MGAAESGDSAEAEDEFASVNSILLSAALLVLIAIGYRIDTHKLRHVPHSGVAMALGFFVGIVVRIFGLAQEEQLLNFKGSVFFYVLLPPIIFEAGLSLETQMFVDNVGAIFSFAVVGTLISTWVTSWGLRIMASIGGIGLDSTSPRLAIHCHLFGALISATDPVATIALFGSSRFRADPLLHALINGESVLNDAVAIALFTTLVGHLNEESPSLFSLSVLGNFLLVSVVSLATGLSAGAVVSWCFNRSKMLSFFPEYEIAAMFLGAYLTFAFCQLLGLSGIVALFFFGVVMTQYNHHNLSDRSKVASEVSFGTMAKLAESCVFVYLGAVAALSLGRFHWHLGLVLYTGILITIARAAHVFPLTMLLNIWRYQKIGQHLATTMWISGLRGAIAFALSLRLPCSSGSVMRHGSDECRNSDLLVTTTISIVVVTTLVVGSTMERVMTTLGVIERVPPGADSPSSRSVLRDGMLQLGSDSALQAPLAHRSFYGPPDGSSASTEATLEGRWLSRKPLPQEDSDSQGAAPYCLADDWESEGAGSRDRWSRAGGGARTLWKARGWLYQSFARFDVNYLQPVLGGPCRGHLEASRADAVELPAMQAQGGTPSLVRPPPAAPAPVCVAEEDPPPACSRAAIFE